MNLFEIIFKNQINKAVHRQLAVAETENNFLIGTRSLSESNRDRYSHDRGQVLEQALEAWRTNPLARRIVDLTSQYVIGSGLAITSRDRAVAAFINEFWNHRLNRMPVRLYEMCDELTRTGNLFLLLSTDAAGMSFVRVIPTQNIDAITCKDNDIEQPLAFTPKASLRADEQDYPAYDENRDDPARPVMLQYTVNRPCGAQWGEPDLAPLLKWLARYSNWLEDRARLNRFRNAFLYVVSAKFASEVQRKARQQALNATPPQPGSILVTDENEQWSVISPRLEGRDASADGLALKKMIACGAGIPMHFLAEPESSTRTTAEAAGGPTYRRLTQRQEFFLWLLKDLLTVVCNRRSLTSPLVRAGGAGKRFDYQISIQADDISTSDNASLAAAAGDIISVLTQLRDRCLIDDAELLRLAYKFTGESVDIEDMLARGKNAPTSQGGLAVLNSSPVRGEAG